MITVSQLTIYPFKSAQGIAIPETGFDAEGMLNDRRLMAIDDKGIFITSRSNPELLQLRCRMNPDAWTLSHPNQALSCPIPNYNSTPEPAPLNGQVWRDKIQALDAGDAAAAWLSEILGLNARIAIWKPNARHSAKYNFETSFADASPILIASEASMRQGCDWAGIPYDARRFRPNLIVSGVEAFAEDHWKQIRIGESTFEILDPCERCILTTRDPDTGEAHPDKQPMAVLMEKHASAASQPLMGMNARLRSAPSRSRIAVGNMIELL
jgi:hypothetical protein